MDKGLQLAIKTAGTRNALANVLGVSRQAVHVWTHVPIYHVLAIEQKLGLPRWKLRPDLWEKPE